MSTLGIGVVLGGLAAIVVFRAVARSTRRLRYRRRGVVWLPGAVRQTVVPCRVRPELTAGALITISSAPGRDRGSLEFA